MASRAEQSWRTAVAGLEGEQGLDDWSAQRFDVAIIEDDVYGELAYTYPRPRTVKSFDDDGRVLLCSSFSKTLAPGLRVGWVAPGRYLERVLHMKYISTIG